MCGSRLELESPFGWVEGNNKTPVYLGTVLPEQLLYPKPSDPPPNFPSIRQNKAKPTKQSPTRGSDCRMDTGEARADESWLQVCLGELGARALEPAKNRGGGFYPIFVAVSYVYSILKVRKNQLNRRKSRLLNHNSPKTQSSMSSQVESHHRTGC